MTRLPCFAVLGLTFLPVAPAFAQAAPPTVGILVAAGDIATCAKEGTAHFIAATATGDLARAIKEGNEKSIPVKVLALGDLAYSSGTTDEFACFAAQWSGLDAAILPVPGNHEYITNGAAPYFEHFKTNAAVLQMGSGKGFFALPLADKDSTWMLIGLNSNLSGDEEKAQRDWLATTLAGITAPTTCLLAFWHAPTFSSGRHGHGYKTDKSTPLSNDHPMQKELGMLYRKGASIVLAGHDHDYEQFKRHDGEGKPADDGIRSFVVGTGGDGLTEGLYTSRWDISEVGPFGSDNGGKEGVLKITLAADSYTWDFMATDGASLPDAHGKDSCNKLH